MKKAQLPESWLTDTLAQLYLVADYSVRTPGIRLQAKIHNKPNLGSYHWPTVQGHINASQLDDIECAVVDLVRGLLIGGGFVREVDEAQT